MRSVLLALLAKESAHGYELKQALEQTFGPAYPSPNIGQIYVTLGRLEKDGLVRGEDVTQSNRPNKRVYELTPAGREAVAEWLDARSEGPRLRSEFFTKLALVPLTGAADRMTLINRQRRHCLNLMRGLSQPGQPAQGGNPIASLLVEGARLHLQADLEWLERCQEALT
ncbi:PadR family transcriptional regulator [Actinoallomurus oryzae]|uniref:PadR family transcriptional regulator n=1 Tax=Actinoallomurus oryzae TaxID=502180 RepID=A0ABP8QL45_9ACTN|nr:helix-turn-helix transcriptional regulator [Actinoallomurus sp. NBC_01490]